MLLKAGSPCLSPYRQRELLRRLQQCDGRVQAVYAEYVHFVDVDGALTAEEDEILTRLLRYGPKAASRAHSGGLALVLPREGTISPWSSKATDIAHNCTLAKVRRLERGVAYWITAEGDVAGLDPKALLLLYDRMTQRVVHDMAAAQGLFFQAAPAELRTVDIVGKGRAELEAKNREWGLALAAEEMDYLVQSFGPAGLNRNPSDVELMMFAQVNSEHCRHKIFNASWDIDGQAQDHSLFQMIRNTHQLHPQGVLSAYKDNGAILQGFPGTDFFPDTNTHVYAAHNEPIHIVCKVETHNHPTAVSPFPGAATGSGGEIRDEGACGTGSKPKAGCIGYTVSNLLIPGWTHEWEADVGTPDRICDAFHIMLEAPLGGAGFNNEFGRPSIAGYFRTFLQKSPCDAALRHPSGTAIRGYHKPICIVGGVGTIREGHTEKRPISPGACIVVLGGPAMLIGLGGGAASSMASGASNAELDFASVQRDNPEMQRRCQEVINACTALGANNPIESIHDVGAGGLSNAVPEIVHDCDRGARLELRKVLSTDASMSPMAIWCNEAQERYVLAVPQSRLAEFEAICRRERCLYAVIGHATDAQELVLADELFENKPIDLPMSVLFGKPPKMHRSARRPADPALPFPTAGIDVAEAVRRILQCPTVASKEFLITIGDRTVKGMTARDQMVGPWQVPVADVGVTCASYVGYAGEAMAMGERTPVALLSPAASARLAMAEAITNIAAADIADTADVKVSANWMCAASYPGEDALLYEAVAALGLDICPKLGIAVPVGKDSMSMATKWRDSDGDKEVVAPVSLVVTAFAPILDVRKTLTPQLRTDRGDSVLLLVQFSKNMRLGASCLAQVFQVVGSDPPDVEDPLALRRFVKAMHVLRQDRKVLAYHDRSDGGLFVTLLEMALAGHVGLDVNLGTVDDLVAALFTEEVGVVVQVLTRDLDAFQEVMRAHQLDLNCEYIGRPVDNSPDFRISANGKVVFEAPRAALHAQWAETSYRMQRARDNAECADEAFAAITQDINPGLVSLVTFDPAADLAFAARPKVAILREQGVNGQVEMAWAFQTAGFTAVDVHMSDLIRGDVTLDGFRGVAAGGGFSYGDVLGAGEGWAKCILYNPGVRAQFAEFFADSAKFALGVCNGCQMMSNLKELIPGAEWWPHFVRNKSEQFEARFVQVGIQDSPSVFFKPMSGSRLPISVAHGEGRAEFASEEDVAKAMGGGLVAMQYVLGDGTVASQYPFNPNGSPEGIAGLTNTDGRVTILMPHPERCARSCCNSWTPDDWEGDASPWQAMFHNARKWVG
eukprot:EG_transcript_583